MKPEPLKNKKCIADGIVGATTFQISNSKSYEEAKVILKEGYYKEMDIKSAVEWLNNKVMENSVNLTIEEVLEYISEAFEDVSSHKASKTKG